MAFILLAAGILIQALPPSAAGSDANNENAPAFVIQDEIRKMQETLRDKGHYQGKIDGVFGLRSRASIRAYQKAENLPITGQADARTADGLGLRPESTWRNSNSAGRQEGHGRDGASDESKRNKPSAGVRLVKHRASNVSTKKVSRATSVEDNHGNGANIQQAKNDDHDR